MLKELYRDITKLIINLIVRITKLDYYEVYEYKYLWKYIILYLYIHPRTISIDSFNRFTYFNETGIYKR